MFEAPRQIQSALAGTADVAVGPAPALGNDLHRIWSALWRGKTTILWTTAASLLLAVVVVLAVPHRFTAATQILIPVNWQPPIMRPRAGIKDIISSLSISVVLTIAKALGGTISLTPSDVRIS